LKVEAIHGRVESVEARSLVLGGVSEERIFEIGLWWNYLVKFGNYNEFTKYYPKCVGSKERVDPSEDENGAYPA
jgi:hypothetical protein